MKKILFIILFFLIIKQSFAQSAMCKAVVEQGGEEMAEGINSGIIYLMVFPYLAIGIGIYFLYRNWKKSKG